MKKESKVAKHEKEDAGTIIKRIFTILVVIVAYTAFGYFANHVVLDKWLVLYDKIDDGLLMILSYAMMAVFLILLVAILKKMHILKFSVAGFKKGLFAGLTLLVLSVIMMIYTFKGAIDSELALAPLWSALAMSVAIIVGVGFTEELLFRGLVENILFDIFGRKTRKSVILTVLITGITFGLWHLTNINAEGANWTYVIGQATAVIGLGVAFSAIYARSRSIWAVALIHGLWDFGSMIGNALFVKDAGLLPFEVFEDLPVMFGFVIGIVPCSLGVLYGMFLLRKKKKKEYLT